MTEHQLSDFIEHRLHEMIRGRGVRVTSEWVDGEAMITSVDPEEMVHYHEVSITRIADDLAREIRQAEGRS